MSLDDLPRYIEAPNGGMWKLPADFKGLATANVFVRLDDVKKLLSPTLNWWEKGDLA